MNPKKLEIIKEKKRSSGYQDSRVCKITICLDIIGFAFPNSVKKYKFRYFEIHFSNAYFSYINVDNTYNCMQSRAGAPPAQVSSDSGT